MKLVPSNKMDFDACANLAAASDEEIAPFSGELLEWLQDMNWPVAPLIQQRLARLGARLVEPIRNVLKGDDDILKFWLTSSLLPSMTSDVVSLLYLDLQQIAFHPTQGERLEEVDVAAQRLLAKSMGSPIDSRVSTLR